MERIDPRIGWLGTTPPRTDDKKTSKKTDTAKTRSFDRLLNQEAEKTANSQGLTAGQAAEEAELEQLLDDVHTSGAELTRLPSPENIQTYKRKIARFLQLIVAESFEVTEKTAWRKKDNAKIKHVLIQRINEKLDKLAAFVLQNQKDKLEIFRRTDELYGLLIDLKS